MFDTNTVITGVMSDVSGAKKSISHSQAFPYLGFGLGLRPEHYQLVLNEKPAVDWFEAISEDFVVEGGRPLYYLRQIREHYPIVLHGVSLSIGSTDPLNQDYLNNVKQLFATIEPLWVSDHLCWTGVNQVNLHDLMPLPYTEEALNHVVERIQSVQAFLGRQILLENVSSYVSYQASELTEWEFLSEVARRADCFILLDINNIYVSSFNHGFDPMAYLNGIPVDRVKQFHMAGHTNFGSHIVDTHDEPIIEGVFKLYREAVKRFGRVSTMIERDGNMPPFDALLVELEQLKQIASSEGAA
jgi:uncharacterized protein (UPF0276 family)